MKLITTRPQFDNDLKDEIRLFFPTEQFENDDVTIEHFSNSFEKMTDTCVIKIGNEYDHNFFFMHYYIIHSWENFHITIKESFKVNSKFCIRRSFNIYY